MKTQHSFTTFLCVVSSILVATFAETTTTTRRLGSPSSTEQKEEQVTAEVDSSSIGEDDARPLFRKKKKGRKDHDGSPCIEWDDQTGAYEDLSAEQKEECVMKMVMAAKGQRADYPDDESYIYKMDTQDFTLMFDGQYDKRPYINEAKTFHTVGFIAAVEFESNGDHPYTGLFQGAPYGLIRMGETHGHYERDEHGAMRLGAAVKFFKDGMTSSDLLAVSTYSQKSGNVFDQIFSTIDLPGMIPYSGEQPAEKYWRLEVLEEKFFKFGKEQNISSFRLGVSDLASHTFDGEAVPENEITSPFMVLLSPGVNVQEMFATVELGEDLLESTFSKIPPGTTLYDVVLQRDQYSNSPEVIGRIKTKSTFTDSLFGDMELRFGHGATPPFNALQEMLDESRTGCPYLKTKLAALRNKELLSEFTNKASVM